MGLHLSSAWIDLGLPLAHPINLIAPGLALLLLGWGWFSLPPGPGRRFALAMLLVPAAILIAPDLLLGGKRSAVTRYFMPLVIMALVTLALAIARGLSAPQTHRRLACQLLLVGLLCAGFSSCFQSAKAPAWWNKSFNFTVAGMADYITAVQQNQAAMVWVELQENGLGNGIALAHRLPGSTLFHFFRRPNLPPAPPPDSKTLVLLPYANGELMAAIAQTYGQPPALIEAPNVYELWQLQPGSNTSPAPIQP
ncbi:MAG: hypothetical protein HC824_07560 [Synechococcales cyanobacterium RM1_1_8]|nr:hypothetical protein [Synechococcales cyanobacterium RM1_1_8]